MVVSQIVRLVATNASMSKMSYPQLTFTGVTGNGVRYTETGMLQLSEAIINKPVLSLRTNGLVAITTDVIINPTNLKIEGWYCQDRFEKKRQLVLQSQDIRDVLPQGLVVNDHDSLSEAEDLVRLKDILDTKFELLGKPVITVSKQKVGKVSDFAIEVETMYIQKLYVSQSLLKSISGGSLSVDRNQIVEITNKKIVIQEILQPTKATAPATAPVTSA
jgi:sporulation protein YlmC with PRC-barrel domain